MRYSFCIIFLKVCNYKKLCFCFIFSHRKFKMDDLQTSRSKKGRRRSLRNLRRSSNFMPTANVSCVEPNVSEGGNIIHNYGSAWFGDENVDPLMVLKRTSFYEQNLMPSLNEDSFIKAAKGDGDMSQVLSLPAKEQVLSKLNFSETFDKPCVEDRSLADLRNNEAGGIEKARSRLFSSPISSIRHGSISSVSDGLPELDLSMYGSVDDCLSTKPPGSFDSSDGSPMTINKRSEQSKDFVSEISQNWNMMHERNNKNGGSTMAGRDCFNDAFMDNCQDLDLVNNLKSGLRSNGEFCLQLPANDVEMQPECGTYEPSSIPSPKIRKVSPENGFLCGAVSSDYFENFSRGSCSVNKTSSVLGITMLSAIQSLTSRLEALSSISDAEENTSSKQSTNSLKNEQFRCQTKSVSIFSKYDSKAAKSIDEKALKKMNPEKLSVSHLDQSCPSDLFQFHIQNDKDTKSTVQYVKGKKRLSLNRRSSSATSDDKPSKPSSPKILTESNCEKLDIPDSEPIVVASEECGYELEECHPGYDSQPSACGLDNMVSVVENAIALNPIIGREENSDIAQQAASNSKLEETILLEELSLRFPDDSMPTKVLKNRRSAGSSRRKSSRWLNLPGSGLYNSEQTVKQDFAEDLHLIPNFDKHLDCTGEVHHSTGKLGGSSLVNNCIDNDTLPGNQNKGRERVASTDKPGDSSCCEKIKYKEQPNEWTQCCESNVTVNKAKSKRKGRRSAKFMSSNYDGKSQMSGVEIQMGKGSNAVSIHNNSTIGDAVADEIMEDLTTVTFELGAEDKLAHSLSKEIDLAGRPILCSLEQDNQNLSEFSGINDATLGLREKSARSQRTCKRRSWVLPTASESSTSLKEKQKRGGRKGVNKTKDNTTSLNIANQDETPNNALDECRVTFFIYLTVFLLY